MASRTFFADIDLDQNEIQFAVLHSVNPAPSSGTEVAGQIYYDTSSNQPFFYNGSNWVSMSSSSASSVPFSGVESGTNTNQTLNVGSNSVLLIGAGSFRFQGSSTGVMTLDTNLTGSTDRTVNLPNVTATSTILATSETPSSGAFAKQSAGAAGTITFDGIQNADIANILSIDDLDDVIISAPANPSYLRYNGSNWVNIAVSTVVSDVQSSIDHGSISGLSDDDHTQYIHLVPATSARNVINPTTNDITSLIVEAAPNSGIASFNNFVIRNSAAASLFTVEDDVGTITSTFHSGLTRVIYNTPIRMNSANIDFVRSSQTITLAIPSSGVTGYTFTLPPVAGTNGNVLKTNGSGTTSWGTLAHSDITGLTTGDPHTQYAAISPATTARNIIQPSLDDVIALSVRAHASQMVDIFVVENSSGTNHFTISSAGNATFSQNVIIQGDLTINGTTTTLNTTELIVEDNIIVVNSGGIVQDAGLEVDRGSNGNASIFYKESEDEWYIDNASVSLQIARKYVDSSTITGDGTETSFDIVHNMATFDLVVAVYDSDDYQVEVEIVLTNSNTVTANFSQPVPMSTTYKVVIVG